MRIQESIIADAAQFTSKPFRVFGRAFHFAFDRAGWCIRNHRGRRHVLHVALTTMEHPYGNATSLHVGPVKLGMVALKKKGTK